MILDCDDSFEKAHLFVERFSSPKPAIFLDRDGVVIDDCHYLSDPEKVCLCSGAFRLIKSAFESGWPVVVVTNQSGISRGLFTWNHVKQVNLRMQELLGVHAPLAAIYANGHGPDAPRDSWRKPNPQMLLEASKALNLDLRRSIMVGDRLSDLEAGAAAGVAIVIHVLSGHGQRERETVVEWHRTMTGNPVASFSTDVELPELKLLDTLDGFPVQILKNKLI